jgi:hypothetical protein
VGTPPADSSVVSGRHPRSEDDSASTLSAITGSRGASLSAAYPHQRQAVQLRIVPPWLSAGETHDLLLGRGGIHPRGRFRARNEAKSK